MPFYCIRHPEPDIPKGICYGRSDIPLKNIDAQLYLKQAETLHHYKDIPKLILSSPLQRCCIPAEELGKVTGIPVKTDERLIEIDFGYWERQSYDFLWKNDQLYQKWCENWAESETPGGDSFTKMQKRMDSLCEEYQGRSLVLYTHAGVIRALMCLREKITPDEAFARKIDYGEILLL